MADVESQQREVQQHPNLHLSPEERRLFGQLFSAADTEKIGVVTGEVAVKFFEKTRLASDVLGEIWQIADSENRGLLTPAGFGIVLRLIGYAQAGRPVSAELALKPGGPLPKFDGITAPPGPPQAQAQAQPLQAQNSGPIRVPPLTPDKVAQYSSLFEESGAQNGILSGETAKQIFERAKLPNDVLGRIWNLADRDQKGHLGLTEFIIAMHLLASYKNGSMRALPQILPSGLYEAAARRGVARQVTGSRPTPDGVSPSGIPRQYTGTGYPAQAPAATRPQQAPFQQATSTGDQWAVSPQDKAQFDQIYATVDTQNRGYITGEQAVGFFSNSRLPEDALAQIWDLADINSEGQLNRDEFAVAMYLIKQQRSKRDGRDVLPQSLPANLIPPSMRRQPIAPQQPTAPVFDNAANISAPKSASEDLFGLDAFSAPSSPPIQPQTRATGDSAYTATPPRNTSSPVPQPFQQQSSQPQPFPQQQSHFKPFVPSSSFGQAMMTPQGTGTSASTASPVVQNRGLPQQQQKQPSAMDDLLGDNDPEVSKRLTNETSELANLSNQVSSLTGQMQDVKSKRGSTENELSQAQSQKRDFEGRLTQLRGAYEQEVREVQALEERLKGSKSETQKLQQEMAMIQGTYEDLQNQHRQISEAFHMDQNENANLKEKIRQTNTEISQMKPQLEKMRSDARQQKGLVAINKKQLATNEAELEKAKADLETAAREHEEATRELEQSKRDLEASSQAVSEIKSQVRSPPAAVASPAPSTASMNPFFRRSSNATTEKGMSPFQAQSIASPNHNAFDSFFGPSLGSSDQSTSGPPPSTSFRNDPPNTHREATEQSMASNRSQNSSYGPEIPTPSGSPPPLSNFSDSPQTSSEPPAPPQSRQITSSFLPFRPNVERSDSESPSVRANPPASRMGDRSEFEGSTERQTSIAEPALPESPRQHFAEMAAKPPQLEASRFTPPSSQQTPTASSEVIRQQEAAVPDEMAESSGEPSANRDVPGAFPGDETPDPEPNFYPSATTPYSSSKLDPRVDSKPRGGILGSTKELSNTSSEDIPAGSDPFAMASNHSHTPVTAKDDFDSAFSGFGDKGKAPEQMDRNTTTNGFTSAEAPKSHGEFPPIQEFGAEDESDSDEERGFGDNFTAHSANRTAESGPNQALQAPPVADGFGVAPTRPPFSTTDTNTTQLPTSDAQTSPPTYDQTVAPNEAIHRRESNQFPAEYSGLLPSRVDPTSPTTSPPPQAAATSPIASTAGIDRGLNFFGEDTAEQAAGHAMIGSSFSQDHSPMSPGASTAAPYAYTHTSSPPQQQSQTTYPPVPAKAPIHDDFDDEFGDLSEAKEASEKGEDDFTPSRHNEFEDFNPVFDSPAVSRHTAQSSSTFPTNDSFADFESSVTGVGSSSRQQQGVQQTPSHDWDAIFSGLDTPQNNGVQGGLSNEFPSPPKEQSGKSAEKPAIQRTMTEDTTTDDPILKELTGMGYPRGESLQALERFDYNLDKAADFLASKS